MTFGARLDQFLCITSKGVYDDVIVIIFIDLSGPPPSLTHSRTNERTNEKGKKSSPVAWLLTIVSNGAATVFDRCEYIIHVVQKTFSFFFLRERKNKKNGSLIDDDVHFVRDRDTKLLGCNEEQQGASKADHNGNLPSNGFSSFFFFFLFTHPTRNQIVVSVFQGGYGSRRYRNKKKWDVKKRGVGGWKQTTRGGNFELNLIDPRWSSRRPPHSPPPPSPTCQSPV